MVIVLVKRQELSSSLDDEETLLRRFVLCRFFCIKCFEVYIFITRIMRWIRPTFNSVNSYHLVVIMMDL